MLARLRISTPAMTSGPPIQLARTGFWCRQDLTQLVGGLGREVMSWGVRMTMRPSLSGSCDGDLDRFGVALRRRHRPRCRWGCCGSSGAAGRRSACHGLVREFGKLTASFDQRIGCEHAGPPALVTMVRRGPRGRGCLASTSAIEKRWDKVSTRRTPQRRKAASSTSSLPASEPVWEAAALAAAAVRPALMTMIGLVRARPHARPRGRPRRCRWSPCT